MYVLQKLNWNRIQGVKHITYAVISFVIGYFSFKLMLTSRKANMRYTMRSLAAPPSGKMQNSAILSHKLLEGEGNQRNFWHFQFSRKFTPCCISILSKTNNFLPTVNNLRIDSEVLLFFDLIMWFDCNSQAFLLYYFSLYLNQHS